MLYVDIHTHHLFGGVFLYKKWYTISTISYVPYSMGTTKARYDIYPELF